MKEIVIKIDDDLHETIIDPNKWLTPKRVNKLVDAVLHGTELPKGHGRLIDADAVLEEPIGNTYKDIDIAETIIEADKQ